MQSVRGRYLVLIAVLLVALAATALAGPADASATPRWPADPALLQVSGWLAGPPTPEATNGAIYLNRDYRELATGLVATLTITTSPEAKRVYRAGPEVPFLGNGYEVESAPASLVAAAPDRGALVAHQAEDRFLEIHTYGERRGRFDHGVIAWGLNVFDTILDRPNDYYLARIVIRLDGDDDDARGRLATTLADALFPQIAAWYARV